MTRRERLERKLEKRREWAESRATKADAEWEKGDLREEKSGMPFGQPVLVGHHSERRHRKAIERADNAMRRAQDHHEMSKHHEQKAQGLECQLGNTIFSDDENAVEALEAKIAKLEAERKKNNAINKIIRHKPKYEETPEKVTELMDMGLSETTAKKLFVREYGSLGIPSYVNQNLGGRIKSAKVRIAQINRNRETQAKAEASNNGVIIEGTEWIAVTFAEKPDRVILTSLKGAGFRWGRGSWIGKRENLPDCVLKSVQS